MSKKQFYIVEKLRIGPQLLRGSTDEELVELEIHSLRVRYELRRLGDEEDEYAGDEILDGLHQTFVLSSTKAKHLAQELLEAVKSF